VQAVNLAFSGDRLLVSTGAYFGNLLIPIKHLNIEGGYIEPHFTNRVGGADYTVISTNVLGPVVFVDQGARVVLDSFHITGGQIFVPWGGGIFVGDRCVVTARNCHIDNNVSLVGGGVAAWSNATFVAHGTAIEYNLAVHGGGLYGFLDSLVSMEAGSWCAYCSSSLGGGVMMVHGRFVMQDGAQLVHNVADAGGGVFMQSGSQAEILDANIAQNQATTGNGGGLSVSDSDVLIAGWHSGISGGCTARGRGGGIYLTNSTLRMRDGAQVGTNGTGLLNQAVQNGGGIYAINSHVVASNQVVIEGNASAHFGGGIYMEDSDAAMSSAHSAPHPNNGYTEIWSRVLLYDTYVRHNSATNGSGGGLYAWASSVELSNTVFAGNAALAGGGIAIEVETVCVADATRVVSNKAYAGGGVSCAQGSACYFDSSELCWNDAENRGGGLQLDHGSARCTDCTIAHNKADSNEDGTGNGGGVYACCTVFHLGAMQREAGLDDNSAVDGGGVYLDDTSARFYALGTQTCTLARNSAIRSGGAVFSLGSILVEALGNVLLSGNSASSNGGAMYANCDQLAFGPTNGCAPAVFDNVADGAGGGLYLRAYEAKLDGVQIGRPGAGNYANGNQPTDGGGGVMLDRTRFSAVNCTFEDNFAAQHGGGLCARDARSVVVDSRFDYPLPGVLPPTMFRSNHALNQGGGVYSHGSGALRVHHAAFINNRTDQSAGAAYIEYSKTVDVVNVLAVANEGMLGVGGFELNSNSVCTLQQCTVADNGITGVVFLGLGPAPLMQNSIVYGHGALQLTTNVVAEYSDIQGGFTGLQNISANPEFVDAGALNYTLMGHSPCIDMGMPLPGITNDCIGTPRPHDAHWDMGCYEWVPEPCGGVAALAVAIAAVMRARRALP
jgi:predicted outer membrane repeat protein